MRLKLQFLGCLLCVSLAHAAAAGAAVPTQFIAKIHTEALGRAPDPQGWTSAVGYFQTNGCSQLTLQSWASQVLASQEFAGLQYDAGAATLVLYRAILNREPDTAGFATWHQALDQGRTLQAVVAALFGTAEFARLVPMICAGGSYSFETQGSYPAIPIPSAQSAGYGNLTETGLQNLLDSSGPSATIYLQQESVVYLTAPLVIPNGVTLATYGLPGPSRHGLMARLVRAAPFAGAMVQIALAEPNASGALKSLWVDGQRTPASGFVAAAVNVEIFGGTGVTVDSNFISNSLGWSTVHSYGSLDGRPCAGNAITNNLITAYPSVHADQEWADGISAGCENSLVENNEIVDPTDAGIVVFTAYPAAQRSLVTGNTVLSAGNSAFGGLGFDPLQGRSAQAPDFSGSAITRNTLWSGPNTHFIIGLAVGTRAWYAQSSIGYGAQATDNTTAGIQTLFGEGIAVSGMMSATVQGNVFDAVPIPQAWTSCPVGDVLASVSAGLASGSIQPYSDVEVNGCMSDNSDPPPLVGAPAVASRAASDPPASGGGGGFGWLGIGGLALIAALRRLSGRPAPL
ncbi:MAG TPA: DUF4214 domain-containing protein [Steroidobacteraceae bacterium]|nr:DUF4214 domain-containing protein [Steroidobacteraceae bacterium]